MWMTGEIKGRYFMKIRRFIAAVLAILALAAFAGCKKHDKGQTVTTGKTMRQYPKIAAKAPHLSRMLMPT